jgi:hypothetical protein
VRNASGGLEIAVLAYAGAHFIGASSRHFAKNAPMKYVTDEVVNRSRSTISLMFFSGCDLHWTKRELAGKNGCGVGGGCARAVS